MRPVDERHPSAAAAAIAAGAPEVAHGALRRIDEIDLAVTVRQEGGDATYSVSPGCVVLLNGERVKLRMLQPGDRVRVAHRLRAGGSAALSIEAVTRSARTPAAGGPGPAAGAAVGPGAAGRRRRRPIPTNTTPPDAGDDRSGTMTDTPITITHDDHARLRGLLERMPNQDRRHFDDLRHELGRARRVAPRDVPGDVVTMGTTALLRELETDETWVFTVCYPEEADIRENRISVLSPVGTAIIGCRVGDIIRWPVPGGTVRIRIERVEHQPEAAAATEAAQEPRRERARSPAERGGP